MSLDCCTPDLLQRHSQSFLWLQATHDKLHAEVPKYKMITPSVLSDRLRVSHIFRCVGLSDTHLLSLDSANTAFVDILQINGSLARAAIRELADQGLIRPVTAHANQIIYTRATNV